MQSWERMVPAVWRLCLWSLEALAECSNNFLILETSLPKRKDKKKGELNNKINGDGRNIIYLSNKEGLSRMILQLCESMPSMREAVVSSLLRKCYICDENPIINNHHRNNTDRELNESWGTVNDASMSWLSNIPPLGFASSEYGIRGLHANEDAQNESFNNSDNYRYKIVGNENEIKMVAKLKFLEARKDIKLQKKITAEAQAQSLLAATILQHIVRSHPEIGASVLSSIMDRLTPSSPSSGDSITLPSSAVLHR